MKFIETLDELHGHYGVPGAASTEKEAAWFIPEYRRIIEASPFLALATAGPEGLDCSPRGDRPGQLVRILDDRTLALPDRRGNDRIDSLRNILRDPRVALMFLIPGSGNALRINGTARLTADDGLRRSFEMEGKRPRTVAIIRAETIYFQCARAVIRAQLWEPHPKPDLPTPGQILAAMTRGTVGGPAYDQEWPERAAQTMW
ncbi:pyridoxamine 5'-phosphate oxidase family protein [Roseococcus sp. SYP-B2431]|uniref:pyridoxamine 5'-phosphate oxidase family protein n=1 Tax=Roseococcus sp. SYP-B2431 TaxID=2496640 RepID=UPI00103D7E0B|nr:pyridoxamine 5'-phosphate oxidase family protein [Roseococcus sp. SYP-B2431]TCH96409.1 pyridoxamine 5'-phosphate oxidase family protein [Roseococcus sp. SYP-B2431]